MKKYRVPTYLILLLLGAATFWYFGHHRPAQKILKAEPKKVYPSVTPQTQKAGTLPAELHSADTSPHTHEEDTPLVSDTEHTATPLSPKQSDLRENAEPKEDTASSPNSEATTHTHTLSKEEQEARQQWKTDIENELEQIQKETFEILREAMPIIVEHLNTLPPDKQQAFLKETKTEMFNHLQQIPELEYLRDNPEFIEKGWKMYLDMLAEAGYTPPRDSQ